MSAPTEQASEPAAAAMTAGAEQAAAPATAAACAACRAPLADDQRYCLQCGEPRAGIRRELPAALRAPVGAGVVEAPRWANPATLLAGGACLLAAMGVGVLIGRGGGTASSPPAITVAAAGVASTPAAAFTSDWPSDRDGWTVALRRLPKASSDAAGVERAVRDATAKGADAVGALDSDAYPTLTAGSYVVYAGVFDDESAARAARGKLTGAFPDATVLHVASSAGDVAASAAASQPTAKQPSSSKSRSAAEPTSADEAGGGDTTKAFEESKKAPKTVGTGGAPPPTDDKPAAGGGDFEEIG